MTLGAVAIVPLPASASSHREAPLISQDPVADNTDLWMFRDPSDATKLDIIAGYIGLEAPAGGPNFVRFGDDVLYEIHIDNNGDVADDITYQFRFRTTVGSGDTFLYNTFPVTDPDDADLNVKQTYSVRRIDPTGSSVVVTDAKTPPVNVGPRSTPDYETNAEKAITSFTSVATGDSKIFAGQRKDPFFVDLGSIFDLGGLRPLNSFHALPPNSTEPGIDGLADKNVHVIALQVPIASVLNGAAAVTACTGANGTSTKDNRDCVIGAYASASRQSVRVLSAAGGPPSNAGRWVQVSRLGFPLVNEVLIPLGQKDQWNASEPEDDGANGFFAGVLDPELGHLLPVLYPGAFDPAHGGAQVPPPPRFDIVSLLTGTIQGLSPAQQLP